MMIADIVRPLAAMIAASPVFGSIAVAILFIASARLATAFARFLTKNQ